jgi:hypothetical protein
MDTLYGEKSEGQELVSRSLALLVREREVEGEGTEEGKE